MNFLGLFSCFGCWYKQQFLAPSGALRHLLTVADSFDSEITDLHCCLLSNHDVNAHPASDLSRVQAQIKWRWD